MPVTKRIDQLPLGVPGAAAEFLYTEGGLAKKSANVVTWSDNSGTALRKPNGALVTTGGYLGEFAWASRPDPAVSPAYSRFLATDSTLMIEFIRSIDATSWLPLSTALIGSGASGSVTGTTAEQLIGTYAVPAGLLTNRRLLFTCLFNKTGTAGIVTVGLKLASTYIASKATLSSATTGAMQSLVTFGVNTQVAPRTNFFDMGFESTSGSAATGTVDTSAVQNLSVVLIPGNAADTVSIAQYTLQLMR